MRIIFRYDFNAIPCGDVCKDKNYYVIHKLDKSLVHAFCVSPVEENIVIDGYGINPLSFILHDIYKDEYKKRDIKDINNENLKNLKIGDKKVIDETKVEQAEEIIRNNPSKYKI